MLRREYPHNTPEQVVEYLRATLAALDEAGVPEDLRAAAFAPTVNLVASKQIMMEQAAGLLPDLSQRH